MAEYEACIAGLRVAYERGIQELEVYGDSALIISHILGQWKVREPKLTPYHACLEKEASRFKEIHFFHLPREKNSFADALATLASLVEIPRGVTVYPFVVEKQPKPAYCFEIGEIETSSVAPDAWFADIWNLLKKGEYPHETTKKDRIALRRLAAQYILCDNQVYKRNFDGTHLRCLEKGPAQEMMERIHEGECGPHMSGHTLARKILRQGYYWTTMQHDCSRYVQRCQKCQKFAKAQKLPPQELYTMTSPWPFSTWGIDVIGKISPKASNGNEYILVAIDYFTKWVEAESYTVLTARKVARFIERNLICRYGVPHEIISDHGSHFQGEADEVLAEYGIQRHQSSPYRPQTNGAVEAANKNLKVILSKMTEDCRDWQEKLPFALWGYRSTERTSTGASPFSLVYGMEAVLPVEIEIPSLRILLESQVSEADWVQARFEQLAMLDEVRLKAMHQHQGYQRRIARTFNKRVRSRDLREGDLVLKEIREPSHDPRGKFSQKWSGPFLIKKIQSGGAALLTDLDGEELAHPVNLDRLKKFYP